MANPEAILQLARLLGRAEFHRGLDLPDLRDGDEPSSLDAGQLQRLHQLLDGRTELLTARFLEEAMASDDVQDPAAAASYLEDRLEFLGELLTEEQRQRIKQEFQAGAASWS